MTTSWGGTSLPDPSTISIAEDSVVAQYKVISGALRTNALATGIRYNIAWKSITAAQFATIYGKAITYSSASITLPEYGTFNVIPVAGSVNGDLVGGASEKHNISCSVYRAT